MQQVTKGRIAFQADPQNERIDEISNQLFELDLGSTGCGRTHNYILLTCVAIEQCLKGAQQGHEQSHSFTLAYRVQIRPQTRRQSEKFSAPLESLHLRSRMIARQLQDIRRLREFST